MNMLTKKMRRFLKELNLSLKVSGFIVEYVPAELFILQENNRVTAGES